MATGQVALQPDGIAPQQLLDDLIELLLESHAGRRVNQERAENLTSSLRSRFPSAIQRK
jgi:hypothetical protein